MSENNTQEKQQVQDLKQILQIRRDKLAELQEAGENPFEVTKFDQEYHTADIINNFDEMDGKSATLAGRLMSKRVMGKASFFDLRDKEGKIQLYVARDELGEEEYRKFKRLDIGDIVGVTGDVFRTQKGEISLRAKSYKLLSKSLQPLPEKFHGMTNTDLRYRQRYIDLIMNEDVKDLVLSGYTMGETRGNISSTDTIGTAFGKLELGLSNLRVE
jgi:lysyl-tRNA synthetase class 2